MSQVKKFLIISILLILGFSSYGAGRIVTDFKPVCDSLSTLMKEYCSVEVKLNCKSIVQRGNLLDFRFSETLGDYPWRKETVSYFRNQLSALFPENYSEFKLGDVYCRNEPLSDYVMCERGNNGNPSSAQFRSEDFRYIDTPLVHESGKPDYVKGLSGRHIALWQSHGLYYDKEADRWQWQRAPLFGTVEDVYTQSYVIPYLVPMLENAGACVILPRERDMSTFEHVASADIISENQKARWTIPIEKGGEYSVYVSYRTSGRSSTKARYTISCDGRKSRSFLVNQKMGGKTWIYIGTFDFPSSCQATIILDNEGKEGSTVNAGKIKVGGGIGVSSHPRFVEAAKYFMEYSGVDSTVWYQNCGNNDYRDDFMARGAWVSYLCAGTRVNPGEFTPPKDGNGKQPAKRPGLGIPVDLSFAFHSDAGIHQQDSIVGTLAIYTLTCDGKKELPNGEKRLCQRQYADMVQSQVVDDVRALWEPQWTRRETWDRSYSESRTPAVPAMLLELLSHQNFADMKYGLDPGFRFTVCRAVYKGMLKFLSNRYGCPYEVQPMPVHNFSAILSDDSKSVNLSWSETIDTLEPTARPKGYVILAKKDNEDFREVKTVGTTTTSVEIRPGHIYSYKVVAYNDGGRSFPSETLSAGVAPGSKGKVLVVNNFTRISGPDAIDYPSYGGFDYRRDSGVPYIRDISFIGESYDWNRESQFESNDSPGFGACFSDYGDKIIAGNTFNYPYIHGRALMKAGYSFCSTSSEAFCENRDSFFAIDIICGKQKTTSTGTARYGSRFSVFPPAFSEALKNAASNGCCILISGANIASDGNIPEFLGYRPASAKASKKGNVRLYSKDVPSDYKAYVRNFGFNVIPREEIYCVESPDGIVPASKRFKSIYRYSDTEISAGVCGTTMIEEGPSFRTVCLGFPIETICDDEAVNDIISASMKYFEKK